MMKKFLFGMVFMAAVIACSKDDPAPAKDKTPLLTGTDWTISEYRAAGNLIVASECFWTNVFIFSADGTYDVDRNCAVLGPAESGTWSFESNQSAFTWDYETDIPKSTVFTITRLDADVFELEANDGDDYIKFESVK